MDELAAANNKSGTLPNSFHWAAGINFCRVNQPDVFCILPHADPYDYPGVIVRSYICPPSTYVAMTIRIGKGLH